MTELIEFLTSKEIIMVYVVAIIACALYFIIHLIDKYYYKRKQRHNTKELNRLVENINYELSKEREEVLGDSPEESMEETVYVEPVLENIEVESTVQSESQVEPQLEPANEQIEEVVEKENIEEQAVKDEIVTEEVITVNINNHEDIGKEEKLDYTSAEPDQTEAQAELKRLTETLEQAEEATKNIDLTSYEEMQEKEAIISLDELLKRSKEMYENNELTQYADEGNEPISLEDLERQVKESLEKVEETTTVTETIESLEVDEPKIIKSAAPEKFVMDDFYTIKAQEARQSKTAYQQYRSMPIISPVYGIEKTVTTKDIELENTANYEKLDEEIKKTNEFLMTLKDLQNNLD